ncbi:MAG TPA: hypothetical protein DEP05_08530 [Betaproteobacteria bacterium]|nr:hypothetical protein [Betaproteobacteria bacterium]
MAQLNYDEAIAITREIHWVGFHGEPARLHCNPYLLIDEQDVLFFDPGSIPDFPVIMRKVIDLVNPAHISFVVASHQDPDVCGNLPVLEDIINRDDLRIVAHNNTIQLIRHYGLRSTYYPVESHEAKLTLRSGRVLEFLHTPYLHSPGAIMTYDPKTKSLFTSDVFGAVSDNWSLFAQGDFLNPMKAWHQTYMPSNRLLSRCMERIEKLEIEHILPQHGSILEGAQVQQAIAYLKALPCGVDLAAEP